jgi:hypothetical protein
MRASWAQERVIKSREGRFRRFTRQRQSVCVRPMDGLIGASHLTSRSCSGRPPFGRSSPLGSEVTASRNVTHGRLPLFHLTDTAQCLLLPQRIAFRIAAIKSHRARPIPCGSTLAELTAMTRCSFG